MVTTKKIIAIMLVIITLLSCFMIPVSAATTVKKKVAIWSCVNPSVQQTNKQTYTIKGNWLSQKKITTVRGSTASSTFGYDSNAINFYKNNAKFRVDIYKNGVWQRAYVGTIGQCFYLPKGSSNYTVVMQTYYSNWKGNSSACWNAANGGTYYLKY